MRWQTSSTNSATSPRRSDGRQIRHRNQAVNGAPMERRHSWRCQLARVPPGTCRHLRPPPRRCSWEKAQPWRLNSSSLPSAQPSREGLYEGDGWWWRSDRPACTGDPRSPPAAYPSQSRLRPVTRQHVRGPPREFGRRAPHRRPRVPGAGVAELAPRLRGTGRAGPNRPLARTPGSRRGEGSRPCLQRSAACARSGGIHRAIGAVGDGRPSEASPQGRGARTSGSGLRILRKSSPVSVPSRGRATSLGSRWLSGARDLCSARAFRRTIALALRSKQHG
jgi:hypothetical protein